MRSFGRCRQRFAPFAPLSQLSHSRDFDFHSLFTGLTEVEDDTFDGTLAIRLIIGRDFVVTRSSPESCCNLFAIASEQNEEQKWLILNKLNK